MYNTSWQPTRDLVEFAASPYPPLNTPMTITYPPSSLAKPLPTPPHRDTAHIHSVTLHIPTSVHAGILSQHPCDREVYNIYTCKTLPNLSHLKPPHTQTGSRKLHIPWTKVKRATGEDVVICRQRDVTDPIAALQRHLQINAINDPSTAIASYLTTNDTRKLLTTSKFMKRCNEIWRAHNRQRYTGHCFRIGGTTHYLLQGINPDIIRLMGRWSSDAFIP